MDKLSNRVDAYFSMPEGACVLRLTEAFRKKANGLSSYALRAMLTMSRPTFDLPLAISLRFGARTSCCRRGFDCRHRQSRCRSGKLGQLNNQAGGRITSLRERRRCQHTGLTPELYFDWVSLCVSRMRQKRVLQ